MKQSMVLGNSRMSRMRTSEHGAALRSSVRRTCASSAICVCAFAGAALESERDRHLLDRAIYHWSAREKCAYRTDWLVEDAQLTFDVVPGPTDTTSWLWQKPEVEREAPDGPKLSELSAGPELYPADGIGFLLTLGLLEEGESQGESPPERIPIVPAYERFDVNRSGERELLLSARLPESALDAMGPVLQARFNVTGFPAEFRFITIDGPAEPFHPHRTVRIDRYRRVLELEFDLAVHSTVVRRDTVDLVGWSEEWDEFSVLGTYLYTAFDCSVSEPLRSSTEYMLPPPSILESLRVPEDFLLRPRPAPENP